MIVLGNWKKGGAVLVLACCLCLPQAFGAAKPAAKAPVSATLLQQGDSAYAAQDYAQAETVYGTVLQQEKSAAVYVKRGNARYAQKRYQEALEDYNQALELSPASWSWYEQRGHAYLALEQWQQAADDYAKAALNSALSPDGFIYKGRALAALGQHQKAAEAYGQAMGLLAGRADLLAARAGELMYLGEWEAALID